jgi:hypothetical protein
MFLIREVLHCKPGQVKPVVERFMKSDELMKKKGFNMQTRIMTDVSGERYWTLVAEHLVPSMEEFMTEGMKMMADPEIGAIMKGYHEHVQDGHREVYQVEYPK